MDPFDDPTEQEKMAALAAALRRREDVGQLFQLTGDKVLSPLGQNLMASADRGEQRIDAGQQRRLQLNLEAKRDTAADQSRRDQAASNEQWRRDQADEHKREFGLRLADLKDRRTLMTEAQAERAAASKEAKDAAQKQKLWTPFAEDFDASKGRTNLNTKNEAQYRRAEELEGLLDAPGAFTPQRLEEAASMAAMIANGGNQPSVEQVRGMYPETARGDVAKFLGFVSSNPHDVASRGFIDQMRNQSVRAKDIGNAQMKRSYLEKLSKHPDVMRNYREDALRRLDAVGITPDMYDSNTLKPLVDPVSAVLKSGSGADIRTQKVARMKQLLSEGKADADIKATIAKEFPSG